MTHSRSQQSVTPSQVLKGDCSRKLRSTISATHEKHTSASDTQKSRKCHFLRTLSFCYSLAQLHLCRKQLQHQNENACSHESSPFQVSSLDSNATPNARRGEILLKIPLIFVYLDF
ncbi:hypothetical protein AAC387_Pa05g2842 [Persea americana]